MKATRTEPVYTLTLSQAEVDTLTRYFYESDNKDPKLEADFGEIIAVIETAKRGQQ